MAGAAVVLRVKGTQKSLRATGRQLYTGATTLNLSGGSWFRKFGLEALQEALTKHGRPEIFNTDQGSQFTASTSLLDAKIAISMDGKGVFA